MCKDTAINYLSSIGFNAIQLPMEGIEPLLVMRMRESGCLEALGSIIDLIRPCTPRLKPDIKVDCPVKNPRLTGLVTDSFGFNFGTDIINDILKQFGVKSDVFKELGIRYEKVRKVKFAFDNILCDATTTGQLTRYLVTGDACDVEEILADMIIDRRSDRPQIYEGDIYNPPTEKHRFYSVVIKTLKSNSLSVFAYDDEDLEVNLGLQLPDGISLGGGCQVSSKSQNILTFQGNKHLIFAVQIAALFVERRGTMASSHLVCKYTLPEKVDDFTGQLFTPRENFGLHPLFDDNKTESNTGVALVNLNQGNPIIVSSFYETNAF